MFQISIIATNKNVSKPLSMLENGKMCSCVHSKCFVYLVLGWGGAKCVKTKVFQHDEACSLTLPFCGLYSY